MNCMHSFSECNERWRLSSYLDLQWDNDRPPPVEIYVKSLEKSNNNNIYKSIVKSLSEGGKEWLSF